MTTKEKVKIKVSTHDFDTKDIDVSLNGTVLNINIGSDTNQVDLSSLIPPRKDFRVVNGTFNPVTKAINLVVSNNTEEDTVTIDLQGLLNIIPTIQGEAGTNGTNGRDGKDGKSAYEIAVQNGFIGTPVEWLKSLKGEKGDKGDAFTYADFTPEQLALLKGVKGDKGADGKSSYDLWRKQGNEGTEQDFLESLKGTDGRDGRDGQLDCGAIASLPLASWKKGTSILASQDGQCKRLVPNETFFQEVGVTMTSDKLSGFTKETYRIVVTVTNSGEGTNEVTDLIITKPMLGNYKLENFTNSTSSGVIVEKLTDFTYKIKNITSGGTAKIEFDVIPESAGSLQFGASINSNTSLDRQSNNNQSTIVLGINSKEDNNYVPSVDCPLIIAKDVESDTLLIQVGTTGSLLDYYYNVKRLNVFGGNRKTLVGKILKFENTSTILILGDEGGYNYSNVIHGLSDDFTESFVTNFREQVIPNNPSVDINALATVNGLDTSFYTFNSTTGELEFLKEPPQFMLIMCRPKGQNCKWQSYAISRSYTINNTVGNQFTVNNLDPRFYTIKTKNCLDSVYLHEGAPSTFVTSVIGDKTFGLQTNYFSRITSNTVKQELHIRLPRNTVHNFSITRTVNNFTVHQQGNLKGVSNQKTLEVTTTVDLDTTDVLNGNDVYIEVV